MRLPKIILVAMLPLFLRGADTFTNLCRQAAESSARHDYTGAIQLYQQALTVRPQSPEALNNLAVMYYEVGRFQETLEICSKLWPAHPELKSAALLAGMAAVQCNRPAEAIRPLESLLKADPSNRDGLRALASAQFALKKLPEAAQVYERMLRFFPQDTAAWYGLAICYESLAEQASRVLSKMPGGSSYSKKLLAEYLQSLGDARLAAEVFGASDKNTDSSPEAARQYGLVRDLAQKSRNAFEQFVRLAPDSWQTALFLGDVDRQHGNLNSAIEHYEVAEKQQPLNPAPLLGLGTAYWELGDFDRATDYLRRTLQLDPRSSQALFEIANIYVRRHQDAQAIPLLKKYLEAQPDALAAHADLGRAYFHLKQYGNAAEELSKAANEDTDGEIHYELYVALKNLDRPAEAEAALKTSKVIREEQLNRSQRLHAVQ